jgi:HMG (high mobility group) box
MSEDNSQKQTIKKASSAYIWFCNDKRDGVKKTTESKKVLSVLGEMWQECKASDGEEYKHYLKLAEDDKLRYQQECENNPSAVVKTVRKKKVSKESSEDGKTEDEKPAKKTKGKKAKKTVVNEDGTAPPPRKLNGYLNYLQAHRKKVGEANPSFGQKEITREVAGMWQLLSPEQKQQWKDGTAQA